MVEKHWVQNVLDRKNKKPESMFTKAIALLSAEADAADNAVYMKAQFAPNQTVEGYYRGIELPVAPEERSAVEHILRVAYESLAATHIKAEHENKGRIPWKLKSYYEVPQPMTATVSANEDKEKRAVLFFTPEEHSREFINSMIFQVEAMRTQMIKVLKEAVDRTPKKEDTVELFIKTDDPPALPHATTVMVDSILQALCEITCKEPLKAKFVASDTRTPIRMRIDRKQVEEILAVETPSVNKGKKN
jgi:hypothetical protein